MLSFQPQGEISYHLNKSGEEWRQTGGRKAPDRGGWASRIHFARRRGARAPLFWEVTKSLASGIIEFPRIIE